MEEIKKQVMELHGDQEQSWRGNQKLLEIVTRASAPGANGDEVAEAIAAEIGAKGEKDKHVHPGHVRKKLCYLISYVVTPKQLPVLIACMGDFYLRESARYAIDRCEGEEATKALVEALDESVGPDFRIGVINALGYRAGDDAKEALMAATKDRDPDVALAAVDVLSRYADPQVDEAIASACHEAEGLHKVRAMKSRIRLAENLAEAGKTSEAKRIYKAIADSDAPAAQKKAVEIGMKKIA